jgi:hypothetical protein
MIMAAGDVVDFFWEWQRSHMQSKTSALAQLALDRCEETLLCRDWERFGYWHAVYMCERRRLEREGP